MFTLSNRKMAFLSILTLIVSLTLQVVCQLTETCDPKTGLCFSQAFDTATETSFGFVLPPHGTFSNDFMAKVTTPLPYGFVGFGVGNATEIPQRSVGVFMTLFTVPGVVGALQFAMLAQQTDLSSEENMLVPAASGGIVTVSTLSTWNATAATFIFRCQNCFQATVHTQTVEVAVFHSYERPIYPTPDALNASLSLKEATMGGFTVPNTTALESTDYDLFLRAAGF
ncbi:hypothetical protein C8R43DRAFT_978197 [Mycena crocata]|nr:hypothetical protein C8R43DRAFT_978197 [Mycena crocata]